MSTYDVGLFMQERVDAAAALLLAVSSCRATLIPRLQPPPVSGTLLYTLLYLYDYVDDL